MLVINAQEAEPYLVELERAIVEYANHPRKRILKKINQGLGAIERCNFNDYHFTLHVVNITDKLDHVLSENDN